MQAVQKDIAGAFLPAEVAQEEAAPEIPAEKPRQPPAPASAEAHRCLFSTGVQGLPSISNPHAPHGRGPRAGQPVPSWQTHPITTASLCYLGHPACGRVCWCLLK